jgi:hypothetical protein
VIEDEIRNRAAGYGARKRVGETDGLFADRENSSLSAITFSNSGARGTEFPPCCYQSCASRKKLNLER